MRGKLESYATCESGEIDPGNACINPQTMCGGEGGGKEETRRLVI